MAHDLYTTACAVTFIASAATDLIIYLTPYYPSNRGPGETPIYVAVSLVYHGAWLLYLARSRQVARYTR